jgi:phospholipase C
MNRDSSVSSIGPLVLRSERRHEVRFASGGIKVKFRSLLSFVLLVACAAFAQSSNDQINYLNLGSRRFGNSGASAEPHSSHVFLIIEENHSFSTVYPTGMPWMSALGNEDGIATNYYSDESGSMLDYLWLSSGSGEQQFGCGGWGCLDTITDDNIFRELNKAGMSWKVYAESIPYAGYMGAQSGEYVKRHNPAPWYSDVVNSHTQQKKMVPFTEFARDLTAKRLANYSLIIPNLLHDAHDGTMAMADQWLKINLPPLLRSSYFQPGGNGVLFITFDNGDGDAQGQVFTGVVGPNVKRGIKVDVHFRHENTLRTMMELLGFKSFPGGAEHAAPMNEFFK